jgi:predicted nucleic acid-binding Zn ribbon protein
VETKKPGVLEELLKGVIKNLRATKLTQEEMAQVWQDAVGKRAAAHTKPVSIRRSALRINVDDSGWLYELTIQRKEILKKLEGKLKGKKLKDIRFRIGEIK